MTDRQQRWFNTDLWPAACRAQGWKPSDRPHKLRVVGQVIGREILSTKDVGTGREFDQLKAGLQHLARPDNLNAALATVDDTGPRAAQRKRWLHNLAQADQPLVAKLTRDFSKGQITVPADLPDHLLKAVVVTLEQMKRGVRYPNKTSGSGLSAATPESADPFTTGETPF
jgi:hypothetical protein